MNAILRNALSATSSAAIFLFIAGLAHCVSDQGSPVVALDGGTVVEEASVVTDQFSVAGTVAGLPASGSVALALNGASPLSAKVGMFVFPDRLRSGQAYEVTAKSQTTGYTCVAANGKGTIASANVTDVSVTCTSSDATLASLSLSDGGLSPAFAAGTVAYTAGVRLSFPFGYATAPVTTVTATPNDPGATITVGGVAVKAGMPSAPITIKAGPNPIDVAVTASDKTTTKHYTIAATGVASDYIKASNTFQKDHFGNAIAFSNDGTTMAVAAFTEASLSTGINGNQADFSSFGTGAVYVFARSGTVWTQQAYIKPSNTRVFQNFGSSIALSDDGNTLAVGSQSESSNATGINGNQADTSAASAGAVYVFTRSGTTWSQQAYVKSAHTTSSQIFGIAVALSADGNTLSVGGQGDSSNATGINGDATDTSLSAAGAAWIFVRSGTTWTQQAYIKASNTRTNAQFGAATALSSDGNTLAVGSWGESSNATGINQNQADTSAQDTGAVYVYTRSGSTWSQQAYVKASNAGGHFGFTVALASDGSTLAVGADTEASNGTGVNGNQLDISAPNSGAAYVFTRTGTTWTQQVYLKAANANARFARSIALSGDGNRVAVTAQTDSSGALGLDGDSADTSTQNDGAAYVFSRAGTTWTQLHYVKASYAKQSLAFGSSIWISRDGKSVAVGAIHDSSSSKGIDGDTSGTVDFDSGAVFVF